MAVERGYVDIGDEQATCNIHYYHCGQGPTVFLLHPSPSSGAAFLPIIERVAEHASVFAIDTPGYGWSEPLPGDVTNLTDYVDALERFRQRLGVGQIVIYGSATGSQLALEYARAYPDQCPSIVLDNVADFQPGERESMMDGYFPDLSIDFGGGHLARIWTMSLDLMRFFPWHWHQHAAARLPARALDPEIVQAVALQYLQAGEHYDLAYRLAFANEHAQKILSSNTPTTIIRSAGSIVRKYADRFDKYEWPSTVKMHACAADIAARQQAAIDVIAEHVAALPAEIERSASEPSGLHIHKHSAGNISTFVSPKRGDDWLILHDIGSSSAAVMDTVSALAREHRVITLDLPGHGASDGLDCGQRGFVKTSVSLLSEMLDAYDAQRPNILAVGAAATLAAAFGSKYPEGYGSMLLVDPEVEILPFNIEPQLDGSHLLSLWHELRNAELYWPRDQINEASALSGLPDLELGRINQAVVDLLLCRGVHKQVCDELNEIARAPTLLDECRFTVGRTTGTTSAHCSLRSFPRKLAAHSIDLPNDPSAWPKILTI